MTEDKFATDQKYIDEALNRVISDFIAPEESIKTLRESFSVAHRSGFVGDEEKAVKSALSGVEWRWPWLEEWASKFKKSRKYPYMWHRAGFVPPDINALETMAELLAHTLTMTAYSIRDWQQFQDLTNKSWYRFVIDDSECPVEKRVSKEWMAKKINGLPPFFPGDRTHISIMTEDEVKELKLKRFCRDNPFY
jgi:hypothetical protein